MKARVLVCDDDAEIRLAMRRTLRAYDVVEASSTREALALLRATAFSALVCDLSIDEATDGLDLLQTTKLMYPNVVRFLVTGNRELEIAVRALNEQSVDRYFTKPWPEHTVPAALQIVLSSRLTASSR